MLKCDKILIETYGNCTNKKFFEILRKTMTKI